MQLLSLLTSMLLFLYVRLGAAETTSSTATTATEATTTDSYLAGPTPAASNAVHAEGSYGYSYIGCYNETTYLSGAPRAVQDGSMQTNNSQTVMACLHFCNTYGYRVCGLEYGRECWGGDYLSSLSAELPSSDCNDGCVGNLTQFCGGSLTLTIYNNTVSTSTTATGGAREAFSIAGAVVFAAALGVAFSVY